MMIRGGGIKCIILGEGLQSMHEILPSWHFNASRYNRGNVSTLRGENWVKLQFFA